MPCQSQNTETSKAGSVRFGTVAQSELVIGERDAFLALVLHQGNDLRVLKLNDLLLSAMDLAGQDGKQLVPQLKNPVRGTSGC